MASVGSHADQDARKTVALLNTMHGLTLKAGLSASLRACATRSWISVFDMLKSPPTSASTRPGPAVEMRDSLESVREGIHGKGGQEPLDVGPICRPDSVLSGIWRTVRHCLPR